MILNEKLLTSQGRKTGQASEESRLHLWRNAHTDFMLTIGQIPNFDPEAIFEISRNAYCTLSLGNDVAVNQNVKPFLKIDTVVAEQAVWRDSTMFPLW